MCHSYSRNSKNSNSIYGSLILVTKKKKRKTEKQRRDLLTDIGYLMETREGLRDRKLATLNHDSEVSLQGNMITFATVMALDILYQGFCKLHP